MERNEKSGETCIIYLGKKKKPRRKAEECKKLNPSNKSLSILDTSVELSSENLISLEEKPESNNKNKIIERFLVYKNIFMSSIINLIK